MGLLNSIIIPKFTICVGPGGLLILLAGEDVDGHNVRLRVAVLAGLGGGHLNALARPALDHEVRALPDLTSLLRVGGRGTGVRRLEGGLIVVRHGYEGVIPTKIHLCAG